MKKEIIFIFLLSLVQLFWSCNDNSVRTEEQVQETVTKNLSSLLPQIQAHQSPSSVTFVYMTDLHNQVLSTSYFKINDQIKKIEHLALAVNELKKNVNLACVIIGGDYLWNTENTSKSAAEDALQDFSETIRSIKDVPILCVKGNHDDNTVAGLANSLTPADFCRDCASYFEHADVVTDASNPYSCYGYYDFKPQKIRFLYLNSVDIPWIEQNGTLKYMGQWDKGVSQKQLDFVKDALTFEEEGWGVVVLSHHALTSVSEYDTSSDSYITPGNGGVQLYNIIKAYKEKGQYTGEITGDFASSVSVDFTNNASNTVYCLLNGHTHCDRNVTFDDMLFCSTTSATLGCDENCPNTDGSFSRPLGNISGEVAMDIVTVDKMTGIVYFDRYGFGKSRNFVFQHK